jgi:hypothetical protein
LLLSTLRRATWAALVSGLAAFAAFAWLAPFQGGAEHGDGAADYHLAVHSLATGHSAIGDAAVSAPGPTEPHADEESYRWTASTIEWHYNPAGGPEGAEALLPLLESAALGWASSVPEAPILVSMGLGTGAAGACDLQADGFNTVTWGPLAGDMLAVTCVVFGGPAGGVRPREAIEFDVILGYDPSTELPLWTTRVFGGGIDFQTAAIHEFGHALGVPHASTCPGQVMCATLTAGTVLRVPQSGDVSALSALYGGQSAIGTAALALALPAGLTAVPWTGAAYSPAEIAAAAGGALQAIYAWDAEANQWLRFIPGGPPYVNTLTSLEPGTSYWFMASSDVTIHL